MFTIMAIGYLVPATIILSYCLGYAYKNDVDDSSLKSSDVNIMPIQTCNSTLAEKAQQQLECKTSKSDNLAL